MSATKHTSGRSVTDCAICDKPLDGHDHKPKCQNCRGPLGHPESIARRLCTACVERLSNPKLALQITDAMQEIADGLGGGFYLDAGKRVILARIERLRIAARAALAKAGRQ